MYSQLNYHSCYELQLDCGNLPIDALVEEAGLVANGAFWESLIIVFFPNIEEEIELDSEANMFFASGDETTLTTVQTFLELLIANEQFLGSLLKLTKQANIFIDC